MSKFWRRTGKLSLVVLIILIVGFLVVRPSVPGLSNIFNSEHARYEDLRSLIADQDWQAANTELSEIILAVTGRQSEGWLDQDAIAAFPCADLIYLDILMRDARTGGSDLPPNGRSGRPCRRTTPTATIPMPSWSSLPRPSAGSATARG